MDMELSLQDIESENRVSSAHDSQRVKNGIKLSHGQLGKLPKKDLIMLIRMANLEITKLKNRRQL